MSETVARWDKKLKLVAWFCALITAAFAATAIDWPGLMAGEHFGAALAAFLTTALVGTVPYAWYAGLVPAYKAGPVLKGVILVALVALSLVPNGWWISTGASTNGWNFIIVPFLQALYLLVVAPLAIIAANALAGLRRG